MVISTSFVVKLVNDSGHKVGCVTDRRILFSIESILLYAEMTIRRIPLGLTNKILFLLLHIP